MTDARAVDRVEALVQHQQPATTPWTPVTDYSFEARMAIEGQHPQVIKDVFQPKYFLDVGSGPGHLGALLARIGLRGNGVDLPDFDITKHTVDNEDFGGYDLVICREVLEHLTILQITQAVRNLVKTSSKYVYVTTRFAPFPTHLLDVDTHDDLDPTHITMLTKSFLRLLFVLEGCRSRYDLEERMDWQHKGRCLVMEVPQ